ncbi:DUF5825 family protein [Streptomyces sp. NPDC001415]
MPTTTSTPLSLTTWRDHDEEVLQLPWMGSATRIAAGPTGPGPAELAAELYRSGARRVALDRPADLSGGTGARPIVTTMLLVAELTSWGLVVDWEISLGADPEIWRSLNHLYPPRAVLDTPDADDIRQQWKETFYLCKCVYRKGPGFIQVRDRRTGGSLLRFTLHDLAYLHAVEQLSAGCPAEDVPAQVLDDLVGESLAGRAGNLAWWLPYRVHRWPWPSFAV